MIEWLTCCWRSRWIEYTTSSRIMLSVFGTVWRNISTSAWADFSVANVFKSDARFLRHRNFYKKNKWNCSTVPQHWHVDRFEATVCKSSLSVPACSHFLSYIITPFTKFPMLLCLSIVSIIAHVKYLASCRSQNSGDMRDSGEMWFLCPKFSSLLTNIKSSRYLHTFNFEKSRNV